MRTCLSFLLALMLSLNAAYVAAVGVCGAQEHTTVHAAHFGHHSHGDSDEHSHGDIPQAATDEAGKVASISDHQHNHVHPSFSSILPHAIGLTPLTGSCPLVATAPGTFISASQALLDRPPRATLA